MSTTTFIGLGILVLLIGYAITLYNNLVGLKHRVAKAWSNIDVLLKQRHDELPKLVETCKQYMGYEQDTLEKVIKARQAVASAAQNQDMDALGQAETVLRAGLGHLFALAEAYPELKANTSFQHLQSRITDLENGIADRRELYNDAVNLNNVRIEQFPDVLIARKFNFGPFKLLEFSEQETADVDIKSLFGTCGTEVPGSCLNHRGRILLPRLYRDHAGREVLFGDSRCRHRQPGSAGTVPAGLFPRAPDRGHADGQNSLRQPGFHRTGRRRCRGRQQSAGAADDTTLSLVAIPD